MGRGMCSRPRSILQLSKRSTESAAAAVVVAVVEAVMFHYLENFGILWS